MKAFLNKEIGDAAEEFDLYLKYGGFPKSLEYDDSEAKATYIRSVVNQIIEKDIKGHKKIRNHSTFDSVMMTSMKPSGFAPTIRLSLTGR